MEVLEAHLTLLYRIIAGADGQDAEVQPLPPDALPEVALKGLRIALTSTFSNFPVASEIRHAVESSALEEAPLPELDFEREIASAGALVEMIVSVSQPENEEQPATLAQYMEAVHRRDQAIITWERFFDAWDILLCPPAMTTAFPHCETGAPLPVDGREVIYWMISTHALLFNYTGHPAVPLPYRVSADGLPIGVQIVGRRWDEMRLLATAAALSNVTGGFRRPNGH